jgi:sulfur carrier protein
VSAGRRPKPAAGPSIVLNGRRCELPAPGTPAAALVELGLDPGARGVAVAVDGEVVPRAEWTSRALAPDARVEVLTAMQGG